MSSHRAPSVSSQRRVRRGVTLIELLVVLVVIGLLLALILPAVFSARDAARRAQCANNLKQLGTAMSAYETLHGALPLAQNGLSTFAMLLPQLDQKPIFNAINLQAGYTKGEPTNETVATMTLQTLLCPSGESSINHYGLTNYAVNLGWGYSSDYQPIPGPFSYSPKVFKALLAEVTDGLSQTAAMAEWRTGVPFGTKDRIRATFSIDIVVENANAHQGFAVLCDGIDPQTAKPGGPARGWGWLTSQPGYTSYTQTLTPNRPSCTVGAPALGIFTASSTHPGGVNVLYLDGHVNFVKDNVDVNVWRSLGTKDSGELISTP